MTNAHLPAPQKTQTFPFDSLYVEYIPELAPIYERNYAARPPGIIIDASIEENGADTHEKALNAGHAERAYTTSTFSRRLLHARTNIALFLEIALSLLVGIFGVGWLMIGKKRTGTLLLVGSLMFYLPLLIISYALAFFSFGLSVLCTGPLAMGAVTLNGFMLYKVIQHRKALSALF